MMAERQDDERYLHYHLGSMGTRKPGRQEKLKSKQGEVRSGTCLSCALSTIDLMSGSCYSLEP